ncbi:endonuclease/exonuclease/phosphatase family protein [Phytomonospora sp. NPDC050363]|uniref:endonuclease/exonuclease/phosphatase family protein n=1 Tax=Phytomonospora sp. NPDC050363 TaxID=3155642 RepID=UPI0033C1A59A
MSPRLDWGRDAKGRSAWTRGKALAATAVLTTLLLVFHSLVPNVGPRLGSLLETFLPWLGVAVLALLVAAVLRRSGAALIALVAPVTAWLVLFGVMALPDGDPDGELIAVQHNVSDENRDPGATARTLMAAEPDFIGVQELTPQALPVYAEVFAAAYPHHALWGSVALWSRHPLTDARPVGIRPASFPPEWNRGLRATATTPHGEIAVYVAHLPSLRLRPSGFGSAHRDESAALLGAAIAAEPVERVILLGDLNGTLDDRGLGTLVDLTGRVDSGFAFSWPASSPVARVDQVLVRSGTVANLRTLPATGSDHLPIVAGIGF